MDRSNTILDGSGELSIGSFCSISSGVQIYSTTPSIGLFRREGSISLWSVSIGDAVYIGSQSIISSGVSIGSHSIVGANTFVNCNIKLLDFLRIPVRLAKLR